MAGSEGGLFFPSLRRETNEIPRTPYDKKKKIKRNLNRAKPREKQQKPSYRPTRG
ncbi:hypothetical protein A343_1898 [Porphyromonas gingivalis JCVI SC001]|nr:hypothetical protein A343_1898 [Porphyromonas gingivalis JCVI SC001]